MAVAASLATGTRNRTRRIGRLIHSRRAGRGHLGVELHEHGVSRLVWRRRAWFGHGSERTRGRQGGSCGTRDGPGPACITSPALPVSTSREGVRHSQKRRMQGPTQRTYMRVDIPRPRRQFHRNKSWWALQPSLSMTLVPSANSRTKSPPYDESPPRVRRGLCGGGGGLLAPRQSRSWAGAPSRGQPRSRRPLESATPNATLNVTLVPTRRLDSGVLPRASAWWRRSESYSMRWFGVRRLVPRSGEGCELAEGRPSGVDRGRV